MSYRECGVQSSHLQRRVCDVRSCSTNREYDVHVVAYISGSPLISVKINGMTVFSSGLVENLSYWKQMAASWNSGADTTATISIFSTSGAAAGNDFALDDLYFSQSCNASQASATVTLLSTPSLTMSWVTDGFNLTQTALNNLSGQNDICSQSFMNYTVNASITAAWYIDGVQVVPGSTVPGFSGTINLTNMGMRLNIINVANDFANHTFQVGAMGPGCAVRLSPPMYVRRVASIFVKGTGYISANTIGTITQRAMDYTFSLVNAITNNYGMGTTLTWNIPGVMITYPNPGDNRTITVNVSPLYSPSVDPVSGNHYIPGTATFTGTSYSCLNTIYSINFAVPANFPNHSSVAGLSGQAAALADQDEVSGSLQVFPNPAHDLLYVRPGVAMGKGGYVEVFTSAGVRVRTIRASEVAGEGLLQVNVTGLANGLYFVVVHTGGNVMRGKFLVTAPH